MSISPTQRLKHAEERLAAARRHAANVETERDCALAIVAKYEAALRECRAETANDYSRVPAIVRAAGVTP